MVNTRFVRRSIATLGGGTGLLVPEWVAYAGARDPPPDARVRAGMKNLRFGKSAGTARGIISPCGHDPRGRA
jgi:hypothetical protein